MVDVIRPNKESSFHAPRPHQKRIKTKTRKQSNQRFINLISKLHIANCKVQNANK